MDLDVELWRDFTKWRNSTNPWVTQRDCRKIYTCKVLSRIVQTSLCVKHQRRHTSKGKTLQRALLQTGLVRLKELSLSWPEYRQRPRWCSLCSALLSQHMVWQRNNQKGGAQNGFFHHCWNDLSKRTRNISEWCHPTSSSKRKPVFHNKNSASPVRNSCLKPLIWRKNCVKVWQHWIWSHAWLIVNARALARTRFYYYYTTTSAYCWLEPSFPILLLVFL